MNEYKTIKFETTSKITINKSIFIGIITHIKSYDDAIEKLNSIKQNYKNVSHYCYAIKTDKIIKTSDDNEPRNTAGLPILNSINKYNLQDVICVVIRIYGGIKLGVGGLIRAYSAAASTCIENSQFSKKIIYKKVNVKIDYDFINIENHLRKTYIIESIIYNDNNIDIILLIDNIDTLKNYLDTTTKSNYFFAEIGETSQLIDF